MTGHKDTSKAVGAAEGSREDRLKMALKSNLARRKAQSRKRGAKAVSPDDKERNEKG